MPLFPSWFLVIAHRSQVVLGDAGLRDLGLAQPIATSVINGMGKHRTAREFAMIDRFDNIVMNCRNVESTASWHEAALGFEREAYQSPAEPGQRIAPKFGRQ
jgi:hypothetical protein